MSSLVSYKDNGVTRWKKEEPKAAPAPRMVRTYMGQVLRERRLELKYALREVPAISLSYLSEIEMGKKEASSEILETVCSSLDIKLSELLYNTAKKLEEAGK